MNLLEKIRSNVEVHGTFWAAQHYRTVCKRQGKPSNFDVFYFALFGKWPARSGKAGK